MNENEAERICSQIKTCDDCNGTGCEPESLRRAEAALSAKEGTP